MAITAALFVSKRLQVVSATFLCLMLSQLVLASCTPEALPDPMAARVPIAGR